MSATGLLEAGLFASGLNDASVGGAWSLGSVAAWLLIGAPALAALIGLPVGGRSRRAAEAIGVGGAVIAVVSALVLVVLTWDGGTAVRLALFGPLDLGRVGVPGDAGAGAGAGIGAEVTSSGLDWSSSAPIALVCLAVTVVALGVQVYATGYLVPHHDDTGPLRYAPFAATVSLFTAAMVVVVGADDLLALLVGWEVMGFCSYLLVGHHSERPRAKHAALQAFLVTRVADVGFVVGILALAAAAGTTNIPRLLAGAESIDPAALAVAGVGLVIGVAGKSAQFPFHGWLPDAMEGPTPVSALIHAATMVAAGVVVLVRLGPLLDRSTPALMTLAALACVSMLGAAVAALAADELKRVLAWSTISQIAVMLAAVALGSDAGRGGALMLMLAHAAFKALLFLGAGLVAVRFGGTRLDGVNDLWRRDRGLAVMLGIGLAGLAAVPPLAGFVGKEGVLTAAEHAITGQRVAESASGEHAALPLAMSMVVFVCLCLTTVLTGLYSGRLFGALVRSDRPGAGEPTTMARADLAQSALAQSALAQPALAQSDRTEELAQPDRVQPEPAQRLAHPGPRFQAAPVPSVRPPEAEPSLTFVDGRGDVQDWDLIAHLDSAQPHRWSRAGRRRRAQEAADARRRLDAGLIDEHTARLSRSVPPERDPGSPAQREPRPRAAYEQQSRLARAMRGERTAPVQQPSQPQQQGPVQQPGQLQPTAPLNLPIGPASIGQTHRDIEPVPGPKAPAAMAVPVWVLAGATVIAGVLPLLSPAGLAGFSVGLVTAVAGTVLALGGVGLGMLRGVRGHRDVATRLPARVRAVAASGFGYHRAQHGLVVRPIQALARLIVSGDDAVIGTWLQAPHLVPRVGRLVARMQSGQVSDYLGWVAGGVIAVAVLASAALASAAGVR